MRDGRTGWRPPAVVLDGDVAFTTPPIPVVCRLAPGGYPRPPVPGATPGAHRHGPADGCPAGDRASAAPISQLEPRLPRGERTDCSVAGNARGLVWQWRPRPQHSDSHPGPSRRDGPGASMALLVSSLDLDGRLRPMGGRSSEASFPLQRLQRTHQRGAVRWIGPEGKARHHRGGRRQQHDFAAG